MHEQEADRGEEELDGATSVQGELSEELAVLHRVFRHDFRNRLNVILGQAELAKADTENTALEEYLDTIIEAGNDLTETVDQVGLIQRLASPEYSPDAVDIAPKLRELITEYDEQSAVTFDSSIPESVWVWMNPSYGDAFREIIENAIVHNDASDPRVTVRVVQRGTTRVCIADNGPGMPPGIGASLEGREVDSVNHLASLGLWTAYWIFTRSGGAMTIEDNQPTGCRITISLRSASPPKR